MKFKSTFTFVILLSLLIINNKLHAQAGSLVWKNSLNLISTTGSATWSTPIAMNDKIYWQCQDGGIICLDAATGSLVWKDSTNFAYHIGHPVGFGAAIYATSNGYGLFALNAENGNVLWKRGELKNTSYSMPVKVGFIYIATPDSLYCLNTSNGSTIWNKAINTNYLILNPSGTELIGICNYPAKVFGFNSLTGNQVWQISIPDSNSKLGAAALKDSTILVIAANDHFDPGFQHYYGINLITKSVMWNKSGIGYSGDFSPPAIYDTLVFVSTRKNSGNELQKIRALAINTGNEIWNKSLRYGSAGRTPIITALDGKVFFNRSDTNGRGYVCANAFTGNELWIAPYDSSFAPITWGGLLIYKNKLFGSPDMGGIYCFDAGTINGSWNMFGCNANITGMYIPSQSSSIANFKINGELKIKLFPNPFSEQIFMEFDLDNPTQLNFDIYNLNGCKVETFSEFFPRKGVHKLNWYTTEKLTNGIYFMRINPVDEQGFRSANFKISLMR